MFEFHRSFGWYVVGANAVAAVVALVAWRFPRFQGRWVWIVTIAAEVAVLVQVIGGVVLVASKEFRAPKFHMFYGFLAFLAVGLAYAYRDQGITLPTANRRRELWYGLVGLFIMGLTLRAVYLAD